MKRLAHIAHRTRKIKDRKERERGRERERARASKKMKRLRMRYTDIHSLSSFDIIEPHRFV